MDTEVEGRMTPTGSLASIDGDIMAAEAASISVLDEGLVRGDGVFEVMRLYDGRPFAVDEHLERMERSARNLRLPLDLEAVRAEMWRLVAEAGSGPAHGQLRIMVTRGGRRILLTEPLHESPEHTRLATVTYAPTRILDGVKSLSYAANMLATRLAVERGFDEALLVTPHGRVLEAPTSSFFWVKDGRLLTPPLEDHILASITRAVILEVTDAEERPCTLDDAREADEAFLASTTREVQPVVAIDSWTYPPDGPVSARTAEVVAAAIRSRLP
jgi:branched-chain amino acid aminotransferase